MVLADSHRISRARCYSGTQKTPHTSFVYGGHTLYAVALTTTSTTSTRPRRPHGSRANPHPTTPILQPLPGITQNWFSLFRFRSPLLTESLLFSLPVGTEMFHFPTFPPNRLYIQRPVPGHDSRWVSPFGHPRITGRLSPPRGLSQTPTSFVGSSCQGIHRTPLKT